MPNNIPFIQGLTSQQQQSIQNLINSGRAFNQTDAQNFGYATGQQNFNQFIGQTGQQALGILSPSAPQQSNNSLGSLFSSFNLEIPDVLNSSILNSNATDGDLQNLLKQQTQYRDRLLASLAPSAEETKFGQDLLNLREGYRAGQLGEKQRTIPQQFITGRLAKMQEQFTSEEANLLDRLGLAQQARQAETNVLQTGLSNISEDINLQIQMQQQLEKQKETLFNQVMSLRQDAQTRLGSILDTFKGLTVDQLDPEAQTQLQVLAQQSGIPFNVISEGLKVVKNQLDLERYTNIQTITDANGNQYSAYFNGTNWVPISGGDAGVMTVDSISPYLEEFDITTYATDPQHEIKINNILNSMGQLNSIEEMDNYIQSKSPDSQITGQMVANASAKYGVAWEPILAIMQQDSSFGTAGLGARNNNPGNIGQFDSLGTQGVKGYESLQEGVNAVAKWLGNHRGKTGLSVKSEADVMNQNVLNVILGSSKFTKEQKRDITNAINTGEDPFTVIKNQAKNIMGATDAKELRNYEVARDQMQSISDLLDDYYDKGGQTSIFKGNYEKVINKLGGVNDSNLVSIATNIASALQVYRNAVSGTAYSVQEGKDIADIFPGINKTQGLNQDIIRGRMLSFEQIIDSTYKNTLGSVYDELKKQQSSVIEKVNQSDENIDSIAKKFGGQVYESSFFGKPLTNNNYLGQSTSTYNLYGKSNYNPYNQ